MRGNNTSLYATWELSNKKGKNPRNRWKKITAGVRNLSSGTRVEMYLFSLSVWRNDQLEKVAGYLKRKRKE